MEICLAVFAFVYVPLIPTWDEVREKQQHLKELNRVSEEEEVLDSDGSPSKIFKLNKQRSAISNEEQ